MDKKRLQQLAGILTEIKVSPPTYKKYKYCWIDSHEDYKELCIATEQSYLRYIEELAEDNETTIENVKSWDWHSDYLEEIPSKPIIFIGWNDEGPTVYDFDNKEEFVNGVGLGYHDLFSQGDLPDNAEYWDETEGKLTQKGVDEGYKVLLTYINNSEADGDSSEACMLIINHDIIASGPYNNI